MKATTFVILCVLSILLFCGTAKYRLANDGYDAPGGEPHSMEFWEHWFGGRIYRLEIERFGKGTIRLAIASMKWEGTR
jgi:hypothetical protein